MDFFIIEWGSKLNGATLKCQKMMKQRFSAKIFQINDEIQKN